MKSLVILCVLALAPVWAGAQDLEFHPPPSAADPAAAALMRDLAGRILPVYQESDPERYLRNLSALQLVAGNYPAAYETREALRERRKNADAHRPVARSLIYDIYAHARNIEAQNKTPFAQAFAKAYRAVVAKLSDEDAYALTSWLAIAPAVAQDALQKSFDQWRGRGAVPLSDALDLIWTYLTFEAYRSFHPLVAALNTEDDARRYVIDWDVLIETPDKASISAVVIRPNNDSKRLPALLEFTIHVDTENFAKECAARGFVGVVAFSRGERRSPGKVVPYGHDGDDARTVIEWIAKQPWSDGHVGMYGTSYSGFTQWAAAKRLPAALKAMATTAATAPGIDFPQVGNIFRNSAYRWSLCVTSTLGLDDKDCNDDSYWRSLDQSWYSSGKSYRALDGLFGKHNAIFRQWINHPSYDRYWQKSIPTAEQFARINIPVLATTGYFAGGEPATLYYFMQHYRHNPHANHTLLIGPYDDGMMQHPTAASLQGYQLDQAAIIDLRDLRYQWFDYVLRGGPKPALLAERVNFEVMGANEWRHAPSLEAMGKGVLKLYLDAATPAGGAIHVLAQRKPADSLSVTQVVNLADRSDANWMPPATLSSKTVQPHNGVTFVGDPLQHPIEFNGLFSGKLDFTVNKMDMDLSIAVYELLPTGDYIQLFDPFYELRASYARDRSNRHLLKAGERQQMTFKSERLTSRKLDVGSRIVVVLSVNKRPDREINYGTGGEVADESIADAKIPLKIKWYSDSYIELPVRR